MRKTLFAVLAGLAVIVLVLGFMQFKDNTQIAKNPPMGWNSFDSYGVYLHEEAALKNVDAMAEKLKPYGYEYYVIDAGWFGEFELIEGTIYPKEKHAKNLNINEFGLLQPSQCYFPNGLQPIIDRCHELGLKFGVHLMRGIPRTAVEKNTPIKGTPYFARDIADTINTCSWNQQNYGVDMNKAGAQEFYNSLINQMADWGVDFLKYDDIVPFPKEVEAVAKAIENCGRPILLSLSPGGNVDENALSYFKNGNMLRVTPDIWDDQKGINECFEAWKKWQGHESPGFWIDMDMIPFGQLQLMSPKPQSLESTVTIDEVKRKIRTGELTNIELLAGKGWTRWSEFTKEQMYTFITLRALSASPLMVGGDLPTIDDFSLKLLTNKDMLQCNQNGVMGSLVYEDDGIETWLTPEKKSKDGWIGIFNRSSEGKSLTLTDEILGLESDNTLLRDIWHDTELSLNDVVNISANDVVFIRFTEN